MGDPVFELAHDHADLNRRVRALGAQIRGLETDPRASARDLFAQLGLLRELLFTHFAREEEGLFPFVTESFADLAPQVHEMEVAHDTICGAVARMHAFASSNASLGAIAALFHRFETAYANHASSEAALLQCLDGRLDAVLRARLASLVDGL